MEVEHSRRHRRSLAFARVRKAVRGPTQGRPLQISTPTLFPKDMIVSTYITFLKNIQLHQTSNFYMCVRLLEGTISDLQETEIKSRNSGPGIDDFCVLS